MSPEEELALTNQAIQAILGGGVAEFGEGMHRVRALDYASLCRRRDELQNQIAQASRSMFVPVREVRREGNY